MRSAVRKRATSGCSGGTIGNMVTSWFKWKPSLAFHPSIWTALARLHSRKMPILVCQPPPRIQNGTPLWTELTAQILRQKWSFLGVTQRGDLCFATRAGTIWQCAWVTQIWQAIASLSSEWKTKPKTFSSCPSANLTSSPSMELVKPNMLAWFSIRKIRLKCRQLWARVK